MISLLTCKMDGRQTNIREHHYTRRSRLGEPGGRRPEAVCVEAGRGQKPEWATEWGVLGDNGGAEASAEVSRVSTWSVREKQVGALEGEDPKDQRETGSSPYSASCLGSPHRPKNPVPTSFSCWGSALGKWNWMDHR